MLLAELAARLASEGLVASGYTVMQNYLPDTPDKVIALNETGGAGLQRFGASPSVEQPGLQVLVRGPARDAATPRTQIEALFQAMQDWGAFVASGTRYLGLTPLQSPFLLVRDGNERVVYCVNFLVMKELSVA